MKILTFIIMLTIFSTGGVVAYLILSENKSNSFDNYESAAESGLFEKGWIPSFIPKSSYNIKEYHSIDESSIHVEFDFKSEDINYFINTCKKIKQNLYECTTSNGPVKVAITNINHAAIESM